MLIDGGTSSASQLIYSYLRAHVDALDVIIATHPHEDHIGGLAAALNAVPVGVIYSPVTEWDSPAFMALQRYASAPIIVPTEGDQFTIGDALVTILHCWSDAWDENDMSIVCRVDYGQTSFLFTGDAEYMSEYMMLDTQMSLEADVMLDSQMSLEADAMLESESADTMLDSQEASILTSQMSLEADVLKVGHHGSRSSSTKEFIEAVSPEYAVISCGRDNVYGHPHEETLSALEGVTVLRTDELGTIVFRSDGEELTIEVSSGIGEISDAQYIGNRKSMKFHYAYCESVQDMSPGNRVPFKDRETAIALGYAPCWRCKP